MHISDYNTMRIPFSRQYVVIAKNNTIVTPSRVTWWESIIISEHSGSPTDQLRASRLYRCSDYKRAYLRGLSGPARLELRLVHHDYVHLCISRKAEG